MRDGGVGAAAQLAHKSFRSARIASHPRRKQSMPLGLHRDGFAFGPHAEHGNYYSVRLQHNCFQQAPRRRVTEEEKDAVLLSVESGRLAATMARGKPRLPPPEEDMQELKRIMDVFDRARWNAEDAAEKTGCSDTAHRNWRARADGDTSKPFPGVAYLRKLREAAAIAAQEIAARDVAQTPTKNASGQETTARPPRARVRYPYSPQAMVSWVRNKRGPMGELRQLPVPGEADARYPELEICVWYNRLDVDRGIVGQEIIDGARNGRFAPQQCERWDGVTWWAKLREAEDAFASIGAGNASGVQRARPKLLPAPKEPKDPKE